MKKFVFCFLIILLMLSGCINSSEVIKENPADLISTVIDISETPTISPSTTPSPTPTSTSTPTQIPPTATLVVLAERVAIIEYHDYEYHNMYENHPMMEPEWFVEQLDFLVNNNFYTMTAQEMVDFVNGTFQPPYPAVMLSVDFGIGRLSYKIMVDLLAERNLHATYNILTPTISDICSEETICWDELKAWYAAGVISYGSHGVDHPNYQEIDIAYQKWDLETSKSILEANLGISIPIFVYPYTAVPENYKTIVPNAGYALGISARRDPVDRSVHFMDNDRFNLPRYYPYSTTNIYPLMYTPYWEGKNQTFEDMIWEAVAFPIK